MSDNNSIQRGMPAEQFIVVDYTSDQEGQLIRESDVVRANNGRFYTREEPTTFKNKSTARCPTYGNCNECCASGPAGIYCQICNKRNCVYQIVLLETYQFGGKYIDAEFLSNFLKCEHTVARADRKQAWLRTPVQTIQLSTLLARVRNCFGQEIAREKFTELRTALEE